MSESKFNDSELARVSGYIGEGRYDDAEAALNRRIASLQATGPGWKLAVKIPELQNDIRAGRGIEHTENGASALDPPSNSKEWDALELEVNDRCRVEMDAGRSSAATRSRVVNSLGTKYGMPRGHALRNRLFAIVADAVEAYEERK